MARKYPPSCTVRRSQGSGKHHLILFSGKSNNVLEANVHKVPLYLCWAVRWQLWAPIVGFCNRRRWTAPLCHWERGATIRTHTHVIKDLMSRQLVGWLWFALAHNLSSVNVQYQFRWDVRLVGLFDIMWYLFLERWRFLYCFLKTMANLICNSLSHNLVPRMALAKHKFGVHPKSANVLIRPLQFLF